MVLGDKKGPGQPANFQKLVFGTAIDTSLLKVGGRFNLAKADKNNYFKATRIDRRADSKTNVYVTPLDTESPDFFTDDTLQFTILDLPGIDGDCLKCDPEEEETICDAIGSIRNDIIELEEEIDAIAPTLERGQWLFNPLGHGSNPGLYGLLALGIATNEYAQADMIVINSIESDGNIHNFADVEEGHYLEVFSPDDGDYGLYLVKANNGESAGGNSYWNFDIEHLRSNRPLADAEGLCRIKFFKLSEGADVDTFVVKTAMI